MTNDGADAWSGLRKVSLCVIGAGFGRTGTLSLKHALEIIGYGPCYHMNEVALNPSHAELWEDAIDRGAGDWDLLFGQYRSTVDWPACAFWRELSSRYPDAKVVLTTRDFDSWYESACSTIFQVMRHGFFPDNPGRTRRVAMARRLILNRTFSDQELDRDHVKRIYSQHIEDVTKGIAPSRLLTMNVSEGWGPLCAFLSVSVPAQAFPSVNDRDAFAKSVAPAR